VLKWVGKLSYTREHLHETYLSLVKYRIVVVGVGRDLCGSSSPKNTDQHFIVHYFLCPRVKPEEEQHHAASKFKTTVPKLGKIRPNRKAKKLIFQRMYYNAAELRRQTSMARSGRQHYPKKDLTEDVQGQWKKQESITARNPVPLSLIQLHTRPAMKH